MGYPRVILIALTALILIGCEQDPAGANRAPVRVAVVLPATGELEAAGSSIRAAAEFARDLINQSHELDLPFARSRGIVWGDEGRRLEVLFRDSRSDAETAARQTRLAIEEDGVAAVVCCYSSTHTAKASEVAEGLRVPFLNADSTSPMLTDRGFRWFFRTSPHEGSFVRMFFDFLAAVDGREHGVPPGLTLLYENQVWGTGVAQAVRRLARERAYHILADIPYDSRNPDLDQALDQVARFPNNILFQASYLNDAIAFSRGFEARNIWPRALLAMSGGFTHSLYVQALGEAAEGVINRQVWSLDVAQGNPLAKQVNALFRSRYGRDLDGISSRTFTAVMVLADALRRAGSVDAEPLRRALLDTQLDRQQIIMPWEGVRFDAKTGQNVLGQGLIVQLQGGEYRTVWPESLATAHLKWTPAP